METKFDGTIHSVRKMLIKLGRNDLAQQLSDTWCWGEVAIWAKQNVPQDLLDEFARRVIATGRASWLYMHQATLGHRDEVLAALIASKSVLYLRCHQMYLGHRDDVAEAIERIK